MDALSNRFSRLFKKESNITKYKSSRGTWDIQNIIKRPHKSIFKWIWQTTVQSKII